jgi:hypothetical protein
MAAPSPVPGRPSANPQPVKVMQPQETDLLRNELTRELYKAIRTVIDRAALPVPRALVTSVLATLAAEQADLVARDARTRTPRFKPLNP